MTATTKLALELLASAAANQTLANTTFAQLNQLVMPAVIDKDLTAPPGSPANEALYIVASGNWGTGSDKTGQLAYWLTSTNAWQFIVPLAGWRVSMLDELDANGIAKVYGYSGSAWALPESGGGGSSFASVVTESTTARVLALTDAGTYIRHTNASSSSVTVAPEADVSWLADTEIHIRRAAAGSLTLTPGAGVTLNAPSGGTLVMTSAMSVTLKRVSPDVWDVIGQTVAV